MKARPSGELAVVEAYCIRKEGKAAWEARVAASGVRATPGWTTIEMPEAEVRRLLTACGHPKDGGADWVLDASGCVLRSDLSGPIARRVLSSLLDDPQACGGGLTGPR